MLGEGPCTSKDGIPRGTLDLQGLHPSDGGGAVDLHGWRPILVHGRRSSLAGQGAAERWRRMWCGTGWGRNRRWGLGAGGDDVQGVIHKSLITWANGGRG